MNNYEILIKYKELLDRGIITQDEFNELKDKLLDIGADLGETEETNNERVNAKTADDVKIEKNVDDNSIDFVSRSIEKEHNNKIGKILGTVLAVVAIGFIVYFSATSPYKGEWTLLKSDIYENFPYSFQINRSGEVTDSEYSVDLDFDSYVCDVDGEKYKILNYKSRDGKEEAILVYSTIDIDGGSSISDYALYIRTDIDNELGNGNTYSSVATEDEFNNYFVGKWLDTQNNGYKNFEVTEESDGSYHYSYNSTLANGDIEGEIETVGTDLMKGDGYFFIGIPLDYNKMIMINGDGSKISLLAKDDEY